MAKKTKRERKFQASGGVQSRLNKGTITKKGKLPKRKKSKGAGEDTHDPIIDAKPTSSARSDDFMGPDNQGQLDIDTFFQQFAEKYETEGAPLEEVDGDDESESGGDSVNENEEDKASGISKDRGNDDDGNSDSEDDSDDEGIEAAEARMKMEMQQMEKQDPDFHAFLQENEQSLLEFGEDDDEESVHSNADDPQSSKGNKGPIDLTAKVLKSLVQGTFKSHGIKAFKKLMGAYKSACHMADAADEDIKRKPGESGNQYIIESSKVFDQLMMICLQKAYHAFNFLLLSKEERKGEIGKDENKPISPKALENSERWANVRPILLSFFRSTLHLLEEAKEPQQLALVLKSLAHYVRFMTPFSRMAEAYLKTLTKLWSMPDDSEEYQVVRLNSFLRIRQLALTQPFPFIEECLKKTYLAYAKRSKFGGTASVVSSLPTLTFMGNCLVELYSLDYHSSYQHAFVYIRQLALLLRTALQKKTIESFQQVYCWQYVFCMKLWVAVLSAAAPSDDASLMRSLIYPLTEVVLGVARSAPSPTRNLPIKFHCIRLLQQLAAASETFIPTTSLLLDCLDLKEWHLKPKKSNAGDARGIQMQHLVRLPKEDALRTHEQLEAGISEFFALMQREIELYRFSPGFPEYSVRTSQRLQQFTKETRNPRWKAYARGCMDTCDRYSAFAIEARAKLQASPKDIPRLEFLRPISTPSMKERHESAMEKERKLLEASRPSPSTLGKRKLNDDSSDDEDAKEDKEEKKPEKKKKKKQTKPAVKKESLATIRAGALPDQDDEVLEGIDWSDEE